MSLRILLAAVLGGIIGYERRRADKPVGLRTLVLISTGAALFTVASVYAFGDGDPARVAAGVVAGIGFLGAGAIIRRQEGGVEGLTTASAIWVAAAIGLAAGVGLYLIATVTTVIVLLVLILLRHD
jgi:putative Mg2+ transporter-C (MgtC) family protein|tara:strand:- start:2117 stop:2494 length:378 start_codon:yes stop_codon:yes gene_type:complete